MSAKTKKIIKWIITLLVIAGLGYGYAFTKVDGALVWRLETMIVFCLCGIYLVALANVLRWLFRK